MNFLDPLSRHPRKLDNNHIVNTPDNGLTYPELSDKLPKRFFRFIAFSLAFLFSPFLSSALQNLKRPGRSSNEQPENGQPEKSRCCSVCGSQSKAEDMAKCPKLHVPVCSQCFLPEIRCQNCLKADQNCEGTRSSGLSRTTSSTGSRILLLLLASYVIIGFMFALLYTSYGRETMEYGFLPVLSTILVSLILPFLIYGHCVLRIERRLGKSRNEIQKLCQAFMQEIEQCQLTGTEQQKPEYPTQTPSPTPTPVHFQQEPGSIMISDKHPPVTHTLSSVPSVLVLSDSSNIVDQLYSALSSTGYTVLAARNTNEALWHFKYTAPDCTLIDATSTNFDGFELGRHIKAMPNCKNIPIIFMIERANEQQIIRSYENGGADYVGKPPHIPEVLARLITQVKLGNLAKTAPESNPSFVEKSQQNIYIE